MHSLFGFCVLAVVLRTSSSLKCYECKNEEECADPMSSTVKIVDCPTAMPNSPILPFDIGKDVGKIKDDVSCLKLTVNYSNSNFTLRTCVPSVNCSAVLNKLNDMFHSYSAFCRTCNTDLCNGTSCMAAPVLSIISAFFISAYYFS